MPTYQEPQDPGYTGPLPDLDMSDVYADGERMRDEMYEREYAERFKAIAAKVGAFNKKYASYPGWNEAQELLREVENFFNLEDE